MLSSLLVATALLIVALGVAICFVVPRRVRQSVAADLIHDVIQGLWRWIFGPRKVRVVGDSPATVVRSTTTARLKGASKKNARKS